jgi:hypothetical protein
MSKHDSETQESTETTDSETIAFLESRVMGESATFHVGTIGDTVKLTINAEDLTATVACPAPDARELIEGLSAAVETVEEQNSE